MTPVRLSPNKPWVVPICFLNSAGGFDAPICQDGRSGGFTELLARAEHAVIRGSQQIAPDAEKILHDTLLNKNGGGVPSTISEKRQGPRPARTLTNSPRDTSSCTSDGPLISCRDRAPAAVTVAREPTAASSQPKGCAPTPQSARRPRSHGTRPRRDGASSSRVALGPHVSPRPTHLRRRWTVRCCQR